MTYDFKTYRAGGFYSWVFELENNGRISVVMTRENREKAFAEIDTYPTDRDAQKYVYCVIVGQNIARASAAQIEKAKQFLFELTNLKSYVPALTFKGQCYEQGIFFDKSPDIAFGIFMDAHRKGDARATLHVSRFYASGSCIPANEGKSLAYMRESAAAGYTAALALEGFSRRKGINGYPRDPELGKKMILDAAWAGNKQAMILAADAETEDGNLKLAAFWKSRLEQY